jgi:hypothetical protein
MGARASGGAVLKAKDIEVGAELHGWTVTDARPGGMWVSVGTEEWDAVVLLTMERGEVREEFDGGTLIWPPLTVRQWYRADEEVNQ